MSATSLPALAKEPCAAGRRRFPHLAWAGVLSPPLLLLLFIILGIHLRLGLGHWPTPMFESYSAPAFQVHRLVTDLFTIFAVFGAGPLWLVCMCIHPNGMIAVGTVSPVMPARRQSSSA